MAKTLELSARLQRLSDWVPLGAKFADVGTDHAYLPVWLMLHGRVVSAIASDLREGPLQRAQETGRTYGAEGVEYRLCPGLDGITSEEADVVAIAGMGGETIASILEAAPWTADGAHLLLLQPMTRAEELRAFLANHGYAIDRECLIQEKGTLYPIMAVKAGTMRLTDGELYGGARLLHDPMGDRYLIEKIIRLQGAVAGLNRSGEQSEREKANKLRDTLTALLAMREEWRRANCP